MEQSFMYLLFVIYIGWSRNDFQAVQTIPRQLLYCICILLRENVFYWLYRLPDRRLDILFDYNFTWNTISNDTRQIHISVCI